MVRKQVYIESEQEELVKRRSKELGITEAALIRRAIDHWAAEPSRRTPRDRQSWEEELAFIRERAKLVVPQTSRTWTREELYEERFNRHRSD